MQIIHLEVIVRIMSMCLLGGLVYLQMQTFNLMKNIRNINKEKAEIEETIKRAVALALKAHDETN